MHERVRAALEAAGILYSTHSLDDLDRPIRAANDVAKALGVSTHQIAKTLLLRRPDGDLLFAVLPSPERLNQPLLEAAAGTDSITLAEDSDLQELGYQHGTVTAIGGGLPVYLDTALFRFEKIYVGSGVHRVEIELSPQDLAFVTSAEVVKIS